MLTEWRGKSVTISERMRVSNEFKQLPSLDQVAERVRKLHQTLDAVVGGVSADLAQMQQTVQQNNQLTDEVLDELSLQIAFLMQTLKLSKPLHGGIADANGKVPTETKTFAQLYVEGGRQKLVEQRKALRDAQGLPPAESPADTPAANGEDHSSDGTAQANAEAGFPKLITH